MPDGHCRALPRLTEREASVGEFESETHKKRELLFFCMNDAKRKRRGACFGKELPGRLLIFSQLYKPDSSIDTYGIDGENILKQVLEKMTELWQRKKSALRRLVSKAEESVTSVNKRSYGSSMLTVDDVDFFNLKAVPATARLKFSPRFRQKVSFDQSGVHIPLEVYDGCKLLYI